MAAGAGVETEAIGSWYTGLFDGVHSMNEPSPPPSDRRSAPPSPPPHRLDRAPQALNPRVALWLSYAAVFALGAWARISRVREVFVGDETIPVDPDCYHHLRRILLAVADFPHVPVREPFMNWPHGADSAWPPGFDQLGALFVLLLGGGGDSASAARIAAFFPVVLGLLVVFGVTRLARSLLVLHPRREPIALASGFFIALLPQAVATSMVGRTDHHVAEALFVVLLAAWTLRRVSARASSEPPRAKLRGELLFEVAGTALLTAAVHVFAGSVLYAAIAAVVLMGAALTEPTSGARWGRRLLGSGAPSFAAAAGILVLLARPQVAVHGHVFSHLYASFMQPFLLAVAAPAIAIATASPLLLRADEIDKGVALKRGALVLAASLAVAALLFGLVPGARVELTSGLMNWLARSDPYMASIDETRPLFASINLFDPGAWSSVYRLFGALGLAAPVLIPAGLALALRVDRARAACLLVFTAGVGALTLAQLRFGREFAVLLAILAAIALDRAAELLGGHLARLSGRALAGNVGLFAGLCALVLLDPPHRNYLTPRPPPPLAAAPRAALFLRDETPPVQRGQGSGVLAPWDMGFILLGLGQRPIVVSGYGPYTSQEAYDAVERVFRGGEGELVTFMRERDLGYLVSGAAIYADIRSPAGQGPFVRDAAGRGNLNGAYFKDMPLAPLIVGGSGSPDIGVPQLAHLRPRFASDQIVGGLPFPVPRLWVYERVAGAVLSGRTTGSDRVVARLQLIAGARSYDYMAWADPADGRFRITVPLPTGVSAADMKTGPTYRISSKGAAPLAVAVPEDAVREGREIIVPDGL